MDAATIEEVNKVRVSLGMKPLPVPGADAPSGGDNSGSESEGEPADTYENREAIAQDNYTKHMEAEANKRRRQERAAAVRRARELAERNRVLEGKGLGEEEDKGDMDAKSWLMGQKKRQKKIDKARKLEEEMAAAEAEAAAAVKYTSKDLAGIKVAHDMSTFLDGDGNEQVLTLKDSAIDANESDDELENVGMREQEKLQDKLDLLKKKPGYNPMQDEAVQGGILSQYDDEIDGKKKKKFTLDVEGINAELGDILGGPTETNNRNNRQTVNLDDIVGDAPISSDYIDASEIKVKKPKKKSKKNSRKKQADEDDIFPTELSTNGNDMDIDSKEDVQVKKRKPTSDTFVDDDDLQASLTAQRKTALKKKRKLRPEDIAQQLKEDTQDDQAQDETAGGLVIGAVSEFVSGLSKPEEEEVRKPRKRATPEPAATAAVTAGDDEEDDEMRDAHESEPAPPIPEPEAQPEPEEEEEEEKQIGSGMGATLALLRDRGLMEEKKGEDYENFRSRHDFLAKKKQLEQELDEETRRQRERDRASGKLDRMSMREREEYARQQNSWRDQQQARRMAELFEANYKPNVDIKYRDELGRDLDTKEAFRHMSHAFHGKGSGKGKTEKLLKKMEEDKRREAQSMFDASQTSGMSRAASQQIKKRNEAGVRLG